jgi:hypothetical protein
VDAIRSAEQIMNEIDRRRPVNVPQDGRADVHRGNR